MGTQQIDEIILCTKFHHNRITLWRFIVRMKIFFIVLINFLSQSFFDPSLRWGMAKFFEKNISNMHNSIQFFMLITNIILVFSLGKVHVIKLCWFLVKNIGNKVPVVVCLGISQMASIIDHIIRHHFKALYTL
jgi:hypothetical protein